MPFFDLIRILSFVYLFREAKRQNHSSCLLGHSLKIHNQWETRNLILVPPWVAGMHFPEL